MRIGPDERIRVENFAIVDLRVLNTFGQILEVHLVNDADARRNELKRFERLLTPLQKLVAFAVALEFHFQIQLQRFGRAEKVNLHGVIDHEIYRHQRLDDFRIAVESLHCTSHRGKIDNQRHAGEILKNDARDHERNFFVGWLLGIPFRQRLDILAADFLVVTISQDGLEHDPNADRQSRNLPDALFLQRRQRIKKSFAPVTGVEFVQRFEFVDHFKSANFALILPKSGSCFGSSLLSACWIMPFLSIMNAERFGTPPIPRLICGRNES